MLNLVSYFLLVNAVTFRRERSILFSWLAILTLLYSVTILRIGTGIGMYGGLFQTISITHIFNLFISIIGAIVLLLTAFYPRRLQEPYPSFAGVRVNNFFLIPLSFNPEVTGEYRKKTSVLTEYSKYTYSYIKIYNKKLIKKMGEQFAKIEYPLIICLSLIGATFLMSISDLVSMFLVIELQSYGLYTFFGYIATICSPGPFIFLLVPAVTYSNAGLQKKQIWKDNKGKSGVYRWTNFQSGKQYIGSSVELERRFRDYYKNYYLSHKKNKNMIICKALKKYDHSSFRLEILEYCEPSNVIRREQYYLDLLKPEYNINPTAGSLLGFKHSEETLAKMSENNKGEKNPMFGKTYSHSEETKAKMSEAHKGVNLSEETKAKMSAAQKGENHPLFGKTHSAETKVKMSVAKGQAVKVLDKETNETSTYSSGYQAAKALGCSETTIRNYIKSQKYYKGRYLIEKKSAVQ